MEYFDTAHTTANNNTGTIFGYAAECWMANSDSNDYSVKVAISKQDMNGTEIDHYEFCTTLPPSPRLTSNEFCSIGGNTICSNPTDPLNFNSELVNIFYKNESDKEPYYYSATLDTNTIIVHSSLEASTNMAPYTDIDYKPTLCLNESIKNSDDLLLDEARKVALSMREAVICPHAQSTLIESIVGIYASLLMISIGVAVGIIGIFKLCTYMSNKNTYTQV
jgi:hypothetical protein